MASNPHLCVKSKAPASGEQDGSAHLSYYAPNVPVATCLSMCLLPYKGGCKAGPGPDPTVWYQGGKSRKLRIFIVLNRPNVAILLTG